MPGYITHHHLWTILPQHDAEFSSFENKSALLGSLAPDSFDLSTMENYIISHFTDSKGRFDYEKFQNYAKSIYQSGQSEMKSFIASYLAHIWMDGYFPKTAKELLWSDKEVNADNFQEVRMSTYKTMAKYAHLELEKKLPELLSTIDENFIAEFSAFDVLNLDRLGKMLETEKERIATNFYAQKPKDFITKETYDNFVNQACKDFLKESPISKLES